MPMQIVEAGVYAGSGGALVGLLIKVIPVLLKKMNGKNINNSVKPGKARMCGDHELLITQLCKNLTEFKETAETARKENREDHLLISKKLDGLK